ncbi:MAG: hypothetical protein QMD13_04550 [Candidatus Bathyarchaeia archaeon]|nr:hypothetical protein [Candidatus Bathyarchaeia archaeon]
MNKKTILVIAFLVVLSTALIYVIIKGSYLSVTHDIAVVSVTPSETEIYTGNIVNITVIIKNEGSQTETFNVTSYHNNIVIETQTVTSLVDRSIDRESETNRNSNALCQSFYEHGGSRAELYD